MASDEDDDIRSLVGFFCRKQLIEVSKFIDLVRNVTSEGRLDAVEAIAADLLVRCLALGGDFKFRTILIGGLDLLADSVDERIFDVLASHPRIQEISVIEAFYGERFWHNLFERGIHQMTNMTQIMLSHHMSATTINRFFTAIQQGVPAGRLSLTLRDVSLRDEDVLQECNSFLRETTQLKALNLGMRDPSLYLSPSSFDSLCCAISDCTSPRFFQLSFYYDVVPQDGIAQAAKSLANAIVNKQGRVLSNIYFAEDTNGLAAGHVAQALLDTEAIKCFDLCFLIYKERLLVIGPSHNVPLPWKPLLAMDNIPLSLWSLILDKANKWNKATSHSSLDAVYFLVKEKSDTLLQNVRRRRIRKRKLFQFESS